jgi:hypothetical protein
MRDLLLDFFMRGLVWLSVSLYRLGAPSWLVELPFELVPAAFRRACALAYFRRLAQKGGAQ